jgi:hypothetical protein
MSKYLVITIVLKLRKKVKRMIRVNRDRRVSRVLGFRRLVLLRIY